MDLDSDGWPQLPSVETKVQFTGGTVKTFAGHFDLLTVGVCTVIRADHVRSAVGKPGGRVTVQRESGGVAFGPPFDVPLSVFRTHAELLENGLTERDAEMLKWMAIHHG